MKNIKSLVAGLYIGVAAFGLSASAASAAVIYDASLSTAPTAQGWVSQNGGQTEVVSSGVLTFGLTVNPASSGYRYVHPTDDFRDGFSLTFRDFRIVSEIIGVTNDPPAIRLGTVGTGAPVFDFRSDRIWIRPTQNSATAFLFDTASAAHDYTLNYAASGDFEFLIDNVLISALSGTTATPSFFNTVDMSDDFFAGSGTFEVSSVELVTAFEAAEALSEPGGLVILGIGIAGLAFMRRKRVG